MTYGPNVVPHVRSGQRHISRPDANCLAAHLQRAKLGLEPTSVKDCIVGVCNTRVVETEGAELVVGDTWHKPPHSGALSLRWSGKTVFVLRQSAGVEVKVRLVEPVSCLPTGFRARRTVTVCDQRQGLLFTRLCPWCLVQDCCLRSRSVFGRVSPFTSH